MTAKKDIANEFNSHYSTLGQKYAEKIPYCNDQSEEMGRLESSMYLFLVEQKEVYNAIQSLKNNKSPGWDKIKSETIKQCKEEIVQPLTFLINLCFQDGCFPDCLKIGKVKPLLKAGNKEEVINYGPSSFSSVFSKNFEKV